MQEFRDLWLKEEEEAIEHWSLNVAKANTTLI